jgi:hypothetical protein
MHTTKAGSSIASYEGAGLRIAGEAEEWEKSTAVGNLTPSEPVGSARLEPRQDEQQRHLPVGWGRVEGTIEEYKKIYPLVGGAGSRAGRNGILGRDTTTERDVL